MALADVNFQEGEGQDFIVEMLGGNYSGVLTDISTEPQSAQYLVMELPEAGGNIFIMSE